MSIRDVVEQWHRLVRGEAGVELLDDLLAADVVFYSPIVYTPQRGKQVTTLYLQAALATLRGDEANGRFRYTKQAVEGDTAVLEFETSLGGKHVNGVDIIRSDQTGRIVEFRVMIRPLSAVTAVHEHMRAALEGTAVATPG